MGGGKAAKYFIAMLRARSERRQASAAEVSGSFWTLGNSRGCDASRLVLANSRSRGPSAATSAAACTAAWRASASRTSWAAALACSSAPSASTKLQPVSATSGKQARIKIKVYFIALDSRSRLPPDRSDRRSSRSRPEAYHRRADRERRRWKRRESEACRHSA